jgi:hypothetical protein
MSNHFRYELVELSMADQPGGLYPFRILAAGREYERRIVVY